MIDIKEQAVGRWLGIFASLGIEVGDGRHTKCPACGGKDRFRCDNKEGKGTYYCAGCGAGDGWSLIQKVLGVDFPQALAEVSGIIGVVEKTKQMKESGMTPEKMRSIFNGSKPASKNDPVGLYLAGRGLTEIPEKLRYHPACWENETKQNQKAMLAIFHGPDNTALTMHRTYIDADGKKLAIESPKKILPSLKKMNGGACRLFPVDNRRVLGIAEGIETAIAARQLHDVPVWASTTAVLLESFEPPTGIERLVVFGDNDRNYTGQKAAYALANRVEVVSKIRADVMVPEAAGADWNDYLINRVEEKQ